MNVFFLNTPWPGLVAWILLYISDYTMTLTCARLYRVKAFERISFGGSYEINPLFQRDINSLRKISPRFLVALLCSAIFLPVFWMLCTSSSSLELYAFVLGFMILMQLALHVRHWRNYFTFKAMQSDDAVRGRIEYSRPFVLRNSSFELFIFSAFYLILFAFVPSGFFLGGVVSCAAIALAHRRLARKAALSIPSQPQEG